MSTIDIMCPEKWKNEVVKLAKADRRSVKDYIIMHLDYIIEKECGLSGKLLRKIEIKDKKTERMQISDFHKKTQLEKIVGYYDLTITDFIIKTFQIEIDKKNKKNKKK